MAGLAPEGIHIVGADGTVLRANLKDRKAGRRVARRLTHAGEPVTLAEAGTDYRRLYVDGSQDGRRPRRSLSDGADRASDSARSLATGDWLEVTDLVDELGDRERAAPASEFNASSPDANQPGIYVWWADEEACRLIGQALGADPDRERPIYIGKAEKTLASRVGAHLRVKVWSSTLRKSLTAILMTDPALAARSPDPDASEWLDELSDWMRKHLEVAIFPVETRQLRQAEKAALDSYDPPLNQQDAPTSSAELTRLRKLVDQRRT